MEPLKNTFSEYLIILEDTNDMNLKRSYKDVKPATNFVNYKHRFIEISELLTFCCTPRC